MEKKILFLENIDMGFAKMHKGDTFNIINENLITENEKGIHIRNMNNFVNDNSELKTIQCDYFINDKTLQQLLDNKIVTIDEVGTNELYFAKTKPNAIIPTKREEDTGYDIYTCETKTIVINPCSKRMIDTGIAIACNKAYFPKFFDKGGMGSKGIIVGAGVGDSGYRDGYFIPLINTNKDKTVVITTQSDNEIEKCNYFNLSTNQFEYIEKEDLKRSYTDSFGAIMIMHGDKFSNRVVKKEHCIIKPITKAITQFVMLPVPTFNTKELSWDELKNIKSERGLGKLGSSGK